MQELCPLKPSRPDNLSCRIEWPRQFRYHWQFHVSTIGNQCHHHWTRWSCPVIFHIALPRTGRTTGSPQTFSRNSFYFNKYLQHLCTTETDSVVKYQNIRGFFSADVDSLYLTVIEWSTDGIHCNRPSSIRQYTRRVRHAVLVHKYGEPQLLEPQASRTRYNLCWPFNSFKYQYIPACNTECTGQFVVVSYIPSSDHTIPFRLHIFLIIYIIYIYSQHHTANILLLLFRVMVTSSRLLFVFAKE